jgi:hypothetical protein
MYWQVVLANTLLSVSFVISDAASLLPLAGVSPCGVAVMIGCAYSLVNSLFLLAGLAIIVSRG